jgi:U32 family peptidase
MDKPELLAPAGDFDKLKVAFHFGADAVYAGMKEFSLRANTKNFDDGELEKAIEYTHKLGKKIYLALNIYFTPEQTEGFIEKLKIIDRLKPDGLIISDLGALNLAKKFAPDIPIHISTQANTTNSYAAEMYKNFGASRIILARELSLKDISLIKAEISGLELEAFIHGAMCVAYSGRCLLSAYMTNQGLGTRKNDNFDGFRSANQGDCSHSCRWEYILKEKNRPDQNYEITEDEEGTYILSSKDICMIDHVGDMVKAGISSFKIEGRMKSILYISSIVRAYRQAIDNYFDDKVIYDRKEIDKELNVVSHREFSTGFFYKKPLEDANLTKNPVYRREMRLAGLVEGIKNGRLILKIYNAVRIEDRLEYIGRNMKTVSIGMIKFYDENSFAIPRVVPQKYCEAELFDIEGKQIPAEVFDILRMESDF